MLDLSFLLYNVIFEIIINVIKICYDSLISTCQIKMAALDTSWNPGWGSPVSITAMFT